MSSVNKRPDGTWRVRWREYPGGPQKSRHFTKKAHADTFKTSIDNQLLAGTYVDPKAGRTPLGEYAATWVERMRPTWRPGTEASVTNSLDQHILPTFARRPLAAIRRSDVEAWAAALDLAPATVANVRKHLGQVLSAAVDDGLIPRNPATGAKMPKVEPQRPRPVPVDVLEAIRSELPDWAQIVVPVGVGLGLRQGELCGLTVDRVNFLRRTVTVDRQLSTPPSGPPTLAPTKTDASNREVPLPQFVADALAAHLAEHGPGVDGLVVRLPDGAPVSRQRFGRLWRAARTKAGAPGVDFHDLRHTFASTLLSEGVNVRAVAGWLGHKSPVVTLTTYAHVMPDDVERGRSVLDRALTVGLDDERKASDA